MKALTLTKIGETIGTGEYTLLEPEFVGLLYNKRNYEFKLETSGIKYLARSNGPYMVEFLKKHNKPFKVILNKGSKGYYLTLAPEIKLNPESQNLEMISNKKEHFLSLINSMGLGVSFTSNKNQLVLTPLPNSLYNNGVAIIKTILDE